MLNKNAYALTIPLYGGADSAIPFPPVCGSADNPPPVLFAKISASVLFRSYSTSPFGNRIWRKKTAHTIKNLPFKNPKPFSRDSVPYPDRGMIPLYPHLQKHKMFLRYRGKGAVPPRQSGGAYLNPNSLKPLYPRTNIVCAKNQVKGMMPLWGCWGTHRRTDAAVARRARVENPA